MNNFSFKNKDSLFETNSNNKLTLDSKHKDMIIDLKKKKNNINTIKKKVKKLEGIYQSLEKYFDYYKKNINKYPHNYSFANNDLHAVKSSNFYIKSSKYDDRNYYVNADESIPEYPSKLDINGYNDDNDESLSEEQYIDKIDIEDMTCDIYDSFISENSKIKNIENYRDLHLPMIKNQILNIKNKIKELKLSLNKLENNEDENNYYLVNGTVIFKYFNGKNYSTEVLNENSKVEKKKIVKKSTSNIENFLKPKNAPDNAPASIFGTPKSNEHPSSKTTNTTEKNDKNLDIEILKREALNIIDSDYYNSDTVVTTLVNDKEKNINEWVSKKKGFNRADIYEKFMSSVNAHHGMKPVVDQNYNKCLSCGSTNLKINNYECFSTCDDCGLMEYIFVDTDKRSYKEPPPENTYFAYKRINHFREWLAQFQAKESTDIPEKVYKVIIEEIDKNRIRDMVNLSTEKVRDFLKKHKLNKYYEHIPHIIYRLNGKKPPVIPKDMEEKLCTLFIDIQTPFNKVKPPGRKNFLSYAFVIYKFCQLLELDELAENFTLLKDKDKLNQQEDIWKKMCKELNWEYIATLS